MGGGGGGGAGGVGLAGPEGKRGENKGKWILGEKKSPQCGFCAPCVNCTSEPLTLS